MDRRLLRYYNRELQFMREMAGEFAKEFPKVASRLSLDEFACADPYVERLLEGFAFLAARVHLKLDAEFPRFTQSLLETVYPHYLAPMPSMAIVQFQPDPDESALAEGLVIPRHTSLRSSLGKGEQTACEYRTAHDVTLWPVEVVDVGYYTRELDSLDLPAGASAKAGLRIRIRSTGGMTFAETAIDRLTFYLHRTDELQMKLYEQILGHCREVVVQPTVRPVPWHERLRGSCVHRCGFEEGQALLPYGARSFHGYRLLTEYCAFPNRFMFVELPGLDKAVRRCEQAELDIILLMGAAEVDLENMLDATNLLLNCTPAINLFPRRADRIHLTDRFSEHHVVPDRTRPRDFEVYQVQGVTGYGARADEEQEFLPFYSASDYEPGGGGRGAYYAVNRVPRAPSARERTYGRRSSYAGSEVYLTLVDAKAAPYRGDLRQLGVAALCTNRDLALQMPVGRGRTDFTMDLSAPVLSIRSVGTPTAPRASHAEGETAWRAISHLCLNYLSLADVGEREGAAALRDLLKLYGDTSDAAIRKQIDGIKSVRSRPITRRVVTPGPIAFARGLEIAVRFEEAAFEGSGIFLLGTVLEEFFAKYVSINSFTETVVESVERGKVMRWPARVGQRETF